LQAADTDTAVTRLREDMARLSGCFSNDSDAVAAFRADVLQALHAAESAVESYERARLRTVSRTGGAAGGLGQQQQGMQLATPGGAQQGGWGPQQAMVPSPTMPHQQQQQQQQGAMSADVRARLAATGRTSHPSSVLVDAVAKAEETASRCDSQILELEAVLLRGAPSPGGSDVANNLGALRASLYDTHAYLLSVAAAVSATHDRVDASKRACVAQRKATGAGGAGVDPFKTADEDAEREAEAAQRHPQPAFATSPIPASPQQMHQQQQQQPGASAAMPGMPAMPAPGATGVSWGGLAAGAAPAAQPAGGSIFGATAPQSTPPLFGAPLGAAPPSPVPFAGFAATPAPFGTAPDIAAPGAKRTAGSTGTQPTMQRTRSSSGRR
jgi:hypothetical protein